MKGRTFLSLFGYEKLLESPNFNTDPFFVIIKIGILNFGPIHGYFNLELYSTEKILFININVYYISNNKPSNKIKSISNKTLFYKTPLLLPLTIPMSIKVTFNNVAYKLHKTPETYSALTSNIKENFVAFKLPAQWTLFYNDQDGDKCLICNDNDLKCFVDELP